MPALYSHSPQITELCSKAEAQILIDQFFFFSPEVNFSDIETASHYPLNCYIRKIIIHKMCSTILEYISKKTPDKNSIPNGVFKLVMDPLLPSLYRFNTCLDTGFCPTHF